MNKLLLLILSTATISLHNRIYTAYNPNPQATITPAMLAQVLLINHALPITADTHHAAQSIPREPRRKKNKSKPAYNWGKKANKFQTQQAPSKNQYRRQ